MSILIKDMKMPKRCEDCVMYRHNAEYDYAYCCISSVNVLGHGNARLNNCPLIEVPTPHGRLIDADELHKAMYHRAFETDGDTMWQSGCWVRYRAIEQVQDSQPTIIEAEEGEEE